MIEAVDGVRLSSAASLPVTFASAVLKDGIPSDMMTVYGLKRENSKRWETD